MMMRLGKDFISIIIIDLILIGGPMWRKRCHSWLMKAT